MSVAASLNGAKVAEKKPTETEKSAKQKYLEELRKEANKTLSHFEKKENGKWCGGVGGVLKTFKYNQQLDALKACVKEAKCGAVNCPVHFNKCELLKPIPKGNPCKGSKGDFLWRKKSS